jgi:hypothetical protein
MRIHCCRHLTLMVAALPLAAHTARIQDAAAPSLQAKPSTVQVTPVPSTTIAPSLVQKTPGDDRRRHLIAILPASAPHSSLGAQAHVFDRFVGAWDSEYLTYGADGTTTRRRGEVIFGWIIDGRALQDVWITYADDGPAGERDIGTSIRFWDAQSAGWRVVWVHPSTGVLIALSGGAVGDRIVLHGNLGDGSRLRWSFNDIRPDAMVWRGEASRDEGKTWRLRNEHRMKRRG